MICERANPEDVLLSFKALALKDLPHNATIGSSSLRRQSQLLHRRPDLTIKSLRGNINTRLSKLERGDFDAIVLARAGIERLNLGLPYAAILPTGLCIPAAGQGALGIECRKNDINTKQLIAHLHHPASADCVSTERAVVRYCQGSCQTPMAAFATINDNIISVEAMIAMADGSNIIYEQASGQDPETLGAALGKRLYDNGGDAILRLYQ